MLEENAHSHTQPPSLSEGLQNREGHRYTHVQCVKRLGQVNRHAIF